MPDVPMPIRWFLLPVALLLASACSREAEPARTNASAEQAVDAAPVVQRKPQGEIDWSPERLEAGDAWIDCSADYGQGDGKPVLSLTYVDLRDTMQDCRSTGLIRLRYKGKVTASFAALSERVGKVATDLGIGKRILDLNSSGGHVEAAIRAGDAIGENDWTIWVRDDSVCHSACVLLLAAGDMRVIAGPVGLHRMIRVGSSASSRKELGEELRKVSEDLRNYLERNGASLEVYDLMTTVPNRSLRILSAEDLERLSLSGSNPVEDDLNRIRLARRCGGDFLRRRDAFRIAYERSCTHTVDGETQDVDAMNTCGLELRKRFGFPDQTCPNDSPMAELDGAILAIPQVVQIPNLELPPEDTAKQDAEADGKPGKRPSGKQAPGEDEGDATVPEDAGAQQTEPADDATAVTALEPAAEGTVAQQPELAEGAPNEAPTADAETVQPGQSV